MRDIIVLSKSGPKRISVSNMSLLCLNVLRNLGGRECRVLGKGLCTRTYGHGGAHVVYHKTRVVAIIAQNLKREEVFDMLHQPQKDYTTNGN